MYTNDWPVPRVLRNRTGVKHTNNNTAPEQQATGHAWKLIC